MELGIDMEEMVMEAGMASEKEGKGRSERKVEYCKFDLLNSWLRVSPKPGNQERLGFL